MKKEKKTEKLKYYFFFGFQAVPFYAGTEVWSASTPADPWASQGQFIHQIDDIRYQHYPGYQTTGKF